MESPPPDRRHWLKSAWVIVGLAVLAGVCAGNSMFAFPFALALYLALGWIWYLVRVLPDITLDVGGILTGLVCLAGLAFGLHLFLRWLDGALRNSSPHWRWHQTGALVGVVLLLFTAGIGAVGVTHQAGWLLRSDEPFWAYRGIREASSRIHSANNLKQIGLAAHAHHNTYKHLPPGGTFDRQGRGMHSWQTFLLPYVEQDHVFARIDLKLPWDHSKNAGAMRQRVAVYQSPFQDLNENTAGYALSHYAGNVRVLGGGTPLALGQITDGTSSTLLAGEVADRFRPWGFPRNWRDPALGINTSPAGFGSPSRERGTNFVFADGSVRFLSERTSPDVLRALSTPAGGEEIPPLD